LFVPLPIRIFNQMYKKVYNFIVNPLFKKV
jgi:hypothetical protein